MCHFDAPFSGSSATPETDLFTPSVSSHTLCFQLKNLAFLCPFLADVGIISVPNMLILWPKFVLKTLVLFKENICSVNSIFQNTCGTYPPKKSECPPPGHRLDTSRPPTNYTPYMQQADVSCQGQHG